MATLTIRDLDDEVKARLRVRAAENGRSMEAEVREILAAAVPPAGPARGLGTAIHARFAAIGGADELVTGDRSEPTRSARFDG